MKRQSFPFEPQSLHLTEELFDKLVEAEDSAEAVVELFDLSAEFLSWLMLQDYFLDSEKEYLEQILRAVRGRVVSFESIIDKWEETKPRLVPIAKEVLRVLQDRSNDSINKMYENINNDPVIAQELQGLLEELLEMLCTDAQNPPSVTQIENILGDFSRNHEGLGTICPSVTMNTHLGYATSRKSFEKRLTTDLTSPYYGPRSSAALYVSELLRCPLSYQQSDLDSTLLSDYPMLSFYQPDSLDDPFRGFREEDLTTAELRRRLGLGYLGEDDQLLYWSHKLEPSQVARTPTAFDSPLNPFFEPGGKTRPLTGDDGLPEVVHPPVYGRRLTRPIAGARTLHSVHPASDSPYREQEATN